MKPVEDIEVISQPSTIRDDIDFKKLLDAVSSILADEYIRIAKENKYIFGIASAASQPRNDEIKHGGLE